MKMKIAIFAVCVGTVALAQGDTARAHDVGAVAELRPIPNFEVTHSYGVRVKKNGLYGSSGRHSPAPAVVKPKSSK